VFQTSNGLIV